MCRDPICNVAEVWCCSELYLWLFDGGFLVETYTAVYRYRAVFSEVTKIVKLAVGKPDLLRPGLTWCHGVLDHGLNFHQNIPSSGILMYFYTCSCHFLLLYTSTTP